ncbi:hypothetical protein FQZ97_983980 [compost metagenome]
MAPGHGDAALPFIQAVDRLLYQAKQQGRNRLESATWESTGSITTQVEPVEDH